jgi:putative colanic acid biosynthesis acetyltransferase WcaF
MKISLFNKFIRVLWVLVYHLLFKFSPFFFHSYRCFILKIFGAKIGSRVEIYPSVKIYLPSNLVVKSGTCIGPGVNIYNQGPILFGRNITVSQFAHLCASTHKYNSKPPELPLVISKIIVEDDCWICADAFIGPGVTLGAASIIGARCVLFKSTVQRGIYVGNPGKLIKKRKKNYKKL